jgi:hypothetical protein
VVLALSLCGLGETGKERTGGNGDEDHEEGAFGVAVADGGGDGGEPFLWVALGMFISIAESDSICCVVLT